MVKSKKMSVLVLAVFLFAVFAGFEVPKASAAAVPTSLPSGYWFRHLLIRQTGG